MKFFGNLHTRRKKWIEHHVNLYIYIISIACRYGVWLLVGLCMPEADEASLEMAGLLSMLFEWYKVTATLPNDKSGAVVEKIKSDFLPPWLRLVVSQSPDERA